MTKANPDEITVHDGPEPFETRCVRPAWITGSLSVVRSRRDAFPFLQQARPNDPAAPGLPAVNDDQHATPCRIGIPPHGVIRVEHRPQIEHSGRHRWTPAERPLARRTAATCALAATSLSH